MRPSVSRMSGGLLGVALAIAPTLVWAGPISIPTPRPPSGVGPGGSPAKADPGQAAPAPGRLGPLPGPVLPRSAETSQPPIRVELGQRQSSVTEVRWQPSSQPETVAGPWQLVSSTTRLERSQPKPRILGFQEIRSDLYQQLTTTYPLEGKEERKKTTTTRDYELRTYGVETSTASTMVPVTRDVGEWVTATVDQPVMTTLQVMSKEPWLATRQVPVYKTVTATYSIPGEAILTPIAVNRVKQESRTVTETRYRTETTTSTQTVYYDGPAGGGTVKVMDEGKTIVLKGLNPFFLGISVTIPPEGVVLRDGIGMFESNSSQGTTRHTWVLAGTHRFNGHDVLTLSSSFVGIGNYRISGGGGSLPVELAGKLQDTRTVTTSRQVPYTETVTRVVDVPYQDSLPLQLEQRTNSPAELHGLAGMAKTGVYWKHYHYSGSPCSFKTVDRVPVTTGGDDSELTAAANGPIVGNLAARVNALKPEDKASFTLVPHHTSLMPLFVDDATAARIGSRSERVVDHYETETYWSTEPHLVSKEVPVQTVVRWEPLPAGTSYDHPHTDPVYRCQDLYPFQPSATGRRGSIEMGGTRTSSGRGFRHSKKPVFAPLTESVTTTHWATRSVTVMEPRTVTSTRSVLVSTVPGQEVSSSVSPWAPTGESRRVGTGTSRVATRSVEIVARQWTQDLLIAAPQEGQIMKAQASSFSSDRTVGNTRQIMSGNAVRTRLRASEAISSQPQALQQGGSILTGPSAGKGQKPSGRPGTSQYSQASQQPVPATSKGNAFPDAVRELQERLERERKGRTPSRP